MADEDLNRPYIGYRSAGRRPESQQDRRASADAPLAALRGFLSGVLGAPGDIESLVRMLPGLSERTILPTSEEVERRLPLRSVSETPVGRVATTGGQLAGGFYNGPGSPLRAMAALPSAVSRAGREFLQASSPAHVIKPKGGNWLTGSVEEAIRPLKRGLPERPGEVQRNVPPGVSWRGMVSAMENRPEGLAYLDELRTTNPEAYARLYPDAALNKWLDTKLGKYMRNEMGTPEDPIRALAERGVTHYDPEAMPVSLFRESTMRARRAEAGMPETGMGQSTIARQWENLSDAVVRPRTAGQQLMAEYPYNAEAMPWLAKVPPETMVYNVDASAAQDLGFPQLVDELRNALNPESGLPANLLLTPEQLGRVSTPQAVELVHKINEYRAAEKAAADLARSQNAATVLHKEYPEAGYRWVELKAGDLPEGWKLDESGYAISPSGYAETGQRDPRFQSLKDALQYEGDVMGHCVGGYCPDVMEGKSRIFSLRSAKGEPHVTIETAPGAEGEPMSIVQIKGKQNRAPKEDYLPYVQDFVRSQKWGDIGDLPNTGLFRSEDYFGQEQLNGIRDLGFDVPDLLSDAEAKAIEGAVIKKTTEGFASGGLVTYNPAEVERLTAPLRAELGLQ